MPDGQSSPRTRRRIPAFFVAGLLVVIAANAPALGRPSPAASASASTGMSPRGASGSGDRGAPSATPQASGVLPDEEPGAPSATAAVPIDVLRGDDRGAIGVADGVIHAGTTVFDDAIPGVARLDSALLGALRRAATDASRDGVALYVDSGWRSPEYQQQLLRQAIVKYGSEKEAARWVATPTTSAHVSGEAVDIGRVAGPAWLSEHGARYGLCQIYGNEPWHFELRPEAIDRGCPPMYADPTHDPRMQQ